MTSSVDLNQIQLRLEFEFTKVNDRIMTVRVTSDSRCWVVSPEEPGKQTLDFDITLPCDFCMEFSGKNNQVDTKIDENGNILEDLCVKVLDIRLDHIPISIDVSKIMILETEQGTTVNSNYVGFNGKSTIKMHSRDAFDQIMTWRRVVDQ